MTLKQASELVQSLETLRWQYSDALAEKSSVKRHKKVAELRERLSQVIETLNAIEI